MAATTTTVSVKKTSTVVTATSVPDSLCVACYNGPNFTGELISATDGDTFNDDNLIACSSSIQILRMFANCFWGG